MEVSGEVADLMVKEGLQVSETAVKLAGSGIKNVAALLLALSRADYKTVGSTSVSRLTKDQSPTVVVPLKKEDMQRFKSMARQYGVLYCAVEPKNNNSGVVDIISTQNYASQLNAVFEAMQYPLPSKEGQTAKKAKALAPQEISSSERGNGSRNTQSNDKPSVREKLEVMKEVAEKQKIPPVRSKDRAR